LNGLINYLERSIAPLLIWFMGPFSNSDEPPFSPVCLMGKKGGGSFPCRLSFIFCAFDNIWLIKKASFCLMRIGFARWGDHASLKTLKMGW